MPTIESASWAAKASAPATTCDSTGLPRTPSKTSGSCPPAARLATRSVKTGSAGDAGIGDDQRPAQAAGPQVVDQPGPGTRVRSVMSVGKLKR